MQYITKDSLLALDITVSEHDADSLINHFNETIEERVGAALTEMLSDAQLEELITLQSTATAAEISQWITQRVPDYEQIIQDTINIVVGELAENAENVNQAA